MTRGNLTGLLLALSSAAIAWACSGSPASLTGGGFGSSSGGTTSSGGGASGDGTLPCAVDQVLANNCRMCHGSSPLYGAPMSLVTLADLHAPTPSNPSVPVYKTVEARTHDDAKPMPQPPNPRLSAADQATIDAWVAESAPSGDACSGAGGSSSGGASSGGGSSSGGAGGGDGGLPTPDDCVFDTHVAPAAPYTMLTQEEYACYGFDVPAEAKHHVTQVRVHLDDATIVHHVLLLESPTSVSSTPTPCNPGPSLGATMLYAWAPGGNPLIAPPEAGFPQDGTTHYLVQIHYNNAANVPSPKDATGFDLCTTPNLRKYDADVIAFGTELISIPPRSTATSTTCFTVPSSLDGTMFFSAFPHMHKLGTSITTSLHADGGAPIDMGTIANWQFSTQPWLTIAAPLHTGDVVRASCSWSNPGDTTVNFGQSTTDEMCFSFSAYYPKASPSLGWAAPSLASVPCP